MTRSEMKHIHKINEELAAAGSKYLLHPTKKGIKIGHDNFGMVTGEYSQDARRHFEEMKHHGFRENSLAHIDPFTD